MLFTERRTRSSVLFLVWSQLLFTPLAAVIKPLELGFTWDYNKQDESPPVTVTQQCETIHIKMDRGPQFASRPNPVSPYMLHVFASGYTVPFRIPLGNGPSFDWVVPFAPGTIYQGCMFDKNGLSGGCQDKYTVIRNFTDPNPTCQNVTLPPELGVEALDQKRDPLSNHGFIDQCSDVTVRPLSTNGTGPYTFFVAASLRPPFQLVTDTLDPFTWTVDLPWALPFWISLVDGGKDSDNSRFMWAIGPQHGGGPGTNGCLAPDRIPPQKARATAVGAGVGALFGGLLLGILGAFLFWRSRLRDLESMNPPKKSELTPSPLPWTQFPPLPPAENPDSKWRTQPWLAPLTQIHNSAQQSDTDVDSGPIIEVPRNRTFVRHQDGGLIVANQSSPPSLGTTEIVDLPPEYMERGGGSSSMAGRNSTSPRPPSKS
ncbi:hypothetical protein CCMSSC00406_0009831 [Pleurotus cornucopiae]|uniref:Uncharacterized protein n=1 Tax=Pleurotus cornucopiae TaxID=5321 RepID=A0ACB7ISY7_PLECO|nr:hypothetical protein CCMSSC00406_0009831 [Pleurotus cornucopiae]